MALVPLAALGQLTAAAYASPATSVVPFIGYGAKHLWNNRDAITTAARGVTGWFRKPETQSAVATLATKPGWSDYQTSVAREQRRRQAAQQQEQWQLANQQPKMSNKRKAGSDAYAGVSDAQLAAMKMPRYSQLQRSSYQSVGAENNFVDLAQANYANDTTGSITLVNTVAQGASVNQRIGKKFWMKSIQLRGAINVNAAGVLNNVANLLVYDKRPTGALPVITDILNTVSSASFNNDANSGRFRIIRRWDKVLAGGSTLATTPLLDSGYKNFDYYVKLNLPTVNKAAGTGAIGDIEEGALYFVTVGNVAAGTAAANTSAGFRMRFKDL